MADLRSLVANLNIFTQKTTHISRSLNRVYDSCMENAALNWTSGWFMMVIYAVKPQLFAYGPHWCVTRLCFLFCLGYKKNSCSQRGDTITGKEGGTDAQECLTSMSVSATGQIISFHIILRGVLWGEDLTWKLQHSLSTRLLHHADCTVQLFSPQPESSHAKDRWRGKKGQDRREGGCGNKPRKREREKDIWRMRRGEIYNNSRLTPPALALY